MTHSWAKASPLSVFINKLLLEHSHAHLFTYCLGFLRAPDRAK